MIEEFKWGLSNEIKTYLSEQKVDTLDNAAWLADDYSLTHKVTFVSKPHSQLYSSDKKFFQSYGNAIKSQSGTPSTSHARNQTSNKSADQKHIMMFFVIFAIRTVTLGLIVGLCESRSLKRVSNLRV